MYQDTMCLSFDTGYMVRSNVECFLYILPRHSAGGVGRFVCTYHSQCACASNGSRELHHFYYIYRYSSEHIFIALRLCSEMIMGFHEYTYQDCEYIIRAMNTKHAQCTCLCIQLVTRLHLRLHFVILSTFVHILAMLASSS